MERERESTAGGERFLWINCTVNNKGLGPQRIATSQQSTNTQLVYNITGSYYKLQVLIQCYGLQITNISTLITDKECCL